MLDPKGVSMITYTGIISNVILHSLQIIATHTYFFSSAIINNFLNKGEIDLKIVLNGIGKGNFDNGI